MHRPPAELNKVLRSVSPPRENPQVSYVICAKDEGPTIAELIRRIISEMRRLGYRDHEFEVIVVDDGSSDGTWNEVLQAKESAPAVVQGLRLRRNIGKASAMDLGFQHARGEAILTLDADLQDDPAEIGRFLEKLESGWDLVVGWKRDRQDRRFKVISSRLFNGLANLASGLRIHDHNCGFKAMRRAVTENITLYGDLHRMLPVFAASHGFKVCEIPVRHHARKHGRSKYGALGLGRATRGFFDLITVMYLHRFGERPSHASGGIGWTTTIVGVLLVALGTARDLMYGEGKLCLILGPMLVVAGLIILNLGLFAELQLHGARRGRRGTPIVEDAGAPMHQASIRPTADEPLGFESQANAEPG